ncbi:SKP1-like protein 13 [Acorus calamus]|uniref:SKP1-like protein 13 n=1 Tax=Acorus calamus TaxID=4465 RepID=A0AAV9C7H8_ACOCL|nr:SKP1-like protein 13 [Acorus calamus]
MSSVLLNNLTEGDDWADKSVTSSINVSSTSADWTAADKKAAEEELKKWDSCRRTHFDANFLDIQGLLELAAQQAANLMKGKKVEDIRDMFGITNDYTAEEEEKLHEKNAWAFL